MKRCKSCEQIISQKVSICPACGSDILDGIKNIDYYKIQTIIHEGHSSLLCKAIRNRDTEPVSIRLFTENSGVDEHVATRLKNELVELSKLPSEHFVQHYTIKKSQEGLWYRVSEWVDADDWGTIFMSEILNDQQKLVTLFYNIASVLDLLHKNDHFMPYLMIDDILIPKSETKKLNIKINYKLSRFLNGKSTRHGPMLQRLLDCHPDIVNQRAIDLKSSVWSLGKIFVELLSADHNLTDPFSKIDKIKDLDPQLSVLIKIMLSDNPDLRPQTMGKVAAALSRILDRMTNSNQRPVLEARKKTGMINEVQWLKSLVLTLILIIVGIVTFTGMSWFYVNFDRNEKEIILSKFVESYASSVAFVMVEYWLSDSAQVFYKNRVEGTAFLVDNKGYLLTNRHVACPWLSDSYLFQAYGQYAKPNNPIHFDYKMYVWFEGKKAFNRLPVLSKSAELSDSYYLSSAYSTGGEGNLRIVGVPRSSTKTSEIVKFPFKNDFAVLKIDSLPSKLKPLPFETVTTSTDIQRLSPVVILGFPLGNKGQDDHINTSITRGHVRRTSKEIIQVDSSIYKGNSGGPAINANGHVIGIASGVLTDQISATFDLNTPLSDFGLILPISGPARFIESIKTGRPQWDGMLDFSLASKLEQITDLAMENKFKEAANLTEKMLKTSTAPVLFYAAGMLNFCNQDYNKSAHFFKKLALLEKENTTSLLMLYIIDWIKNPKTAKPVSSQLFNMTWQDQDEFLSYLATVLKDKKRMKPKLIDYETKSEKSWRLFIEGLILEQKNKLKSAQKVFKQSILSAGAGDWVYSLSFSRLIYIQTKLSAFKKITRTQKKKIEAFRRKATKQRLKTTEKTESIAALVNLFESSQLSDEERIATYAKLLNLAPESRIIIGRIAFSHAIFSEWEKALETIDLYFKNPCRETSLSLGLGLLKGQILKINGKQKESQKHLNKFLNSIQDPWYKLITKHLIMDTREDILIKLAEKKPEKLITLHTALGFWAEADQNHLKASHHYREALSSYLDDWNEYDLALGRIIGLRHISNN